MCIEIIERSKVHWDLEDTCQHQSDGSAKPFARECIPRTHGNPHSRRLTYRYWLEMSDTEIRFFIQMYLHKRFGSTEHEVFSHRAVTENTLAVVSKELEHDYELTSQQRPTSPAAASKRGLCVPGTKGSAIEIDIDPLIGSSSNANALESAQWAQELVGEGPSSITNPVEAAVSNAPPMPRKNNVKGTAILKDSDISHEFSNRQGPHTRASIDSSGESVPPQSNPNDRHTDPLNSKGKHTYMPSHISGGLRSSLSQSSEESPRLQPSKRVRLVDLSQGERQPRQEDLAVPTGLRYPPSRSRRPKPLSTIDTLRRDAVMAATSSNPISPRRQAKNYTSQLGNKQQQEKQARQRQGQSQDDVYSSSQTS